MEQSCISSITRGKVSIARKAIKHMKELFAIQVTTMHCTEHFIEKVSNDK